MVERQSPGVKAKAIRGIAFRAVNPIADDRAAQVGEVDANLVLASRLQFDFDE